MLICNVIAKEFPLITKKFVTATQKINQEKDKIQEKMNNFCQKWQIKTGQMTSFFKNKILKNQTSDTAETEKDTTVQGSQSGLKITGKDTPVVSDSANANNTTLTAESTSTGVTEVENWFLSQAKQSHYVKYWAKHYKIAVKNMKFYQLWY